VIVDDFDVIGITISPRETYPPLVVDPNAVLPDTIAAKLL
jgi:hypothetical protein